MAQRRAEFTEWMRPYDALLLPTVAVPAIPLSEVDETSPIPGYLTRPGNYLGLCGLPMPSGFSSGLPLGIQILGKPYAERDVLRLGKAFQDATDFHRRAPDLSAALGPRVRSRSNAAACPAGRRSATIEASSASYS